MNDLPVGRSVDETLRLVQAFQYTDMHGEVCPAGWKPGAATVSYLEIQYFYFVLLDSQALQNNCQKNLSRSCIPNWQRDCNGHQ